MIERHSIESMLFSQTKRLYLKEGEMFEYYFVGWLVFIAFIYMNVVFALTSSMDLQPGGSKDRTPEGIEPNWMGTAEGTAIRKIKYLKPPAHEPVTQAH